MRNILTLLACLALGSFTIGCSRAGELCDLKCECEGCSDREYDECVIDFDAQEETASAYGCDDLYAIAHDCTVLNNDCTSIGNLDIFSAEPECGDEIADWIDCVGDQSSL